MATLGMEKACVVGGSGQVASFLEKGYSINSTVRDPGNKKVVSHLEGLKDLGDLQLFQADLTEETSFDATVSGCDYVFHVTTPFNFASEDPENDMIKPATQGVVNVLKACKKANCVKAHCSDFVCSSRLG